MKKWQHNEIKLGSTAPFLKAGVTDVTSNGKAFLEDFLQSVKFTEKHQKSLSFTTSWVGV